MPIEMVWIFGATAALFIAMTTGALWHLRWVRRLPGLTSLPQPQTTAAATASAPPRCSVIVAARNEEARIEKTILHLLSQGHVQLEIIVIDDRSTDRTSEILQEIAKQDPRIRVRRVEALPEGWLGKCHACHIGASVATGEWLLFTDADCWLKHDVIARAIRLAERDAVDHVTLSPGTIVESSPAKSWHLLFLISLANWFSGVNRDRPRAYVGIGAFNLVRREAYQQCGGYETLRLTVVDDLKLGLLLRRAGRRTRAFLGVDDVECHWGATIWQMIKVMEKNYFAVIEFRTSIALGGSLFTLAVLGILIAGLVTRTPAGLTAALSPLLLIIPGGILARRVGWPWTSALCVPFMIPVFLYALLNSTFVTLSRGGIRWRDTFYSLKALRAGNVQ